MLRVGKRFVKSSDKGVGVALWLSRPFSDEGYRRVVCLAMAGFVVVWLGHRWLSEDALLTFREVINLVEGYGIVWNAGERVQVFTHPSWFLLLSVAHIIGGGLWDASALKYSSQLFTFCFSCGALWFFLKEVKGLAKVFVLAFLLTLLSSQAFTDYTSSGLENPLSYFLVVLVCCRFFSDRHDRIFFLACALLFLNRMDYALLLLPLCLYAWRSCGYKISIIFPAAILCLLWFVFSTWYFGYPLPNTFLAKMNADVPVSDFLNQGFIYYKRTLTQDPITLFIVFFVIFFSCYRMLRLQRLTALGCIGLGSLLYGLYVLWIGGDYMQGRFFSVLFFFALCGLAFWLKDKNFTEDSLRNLLRNSLQNFLRISRHPWNGVAWCFLAMVIVLSSASILQRIDKAFFTSRFERMKRIEGIENRRYIGRRGALNISYNSFVFRVPNAVFVHCCPTYWGITQRGENYIVDNLALISPYLSQLPAHTWRVGHAGRALPTDFEAWAIDASDSLYDTRLNAFFSDIRDVTRGDLFSWNRMKKIAKINLSDYKVDYLSKLNNPRFSRFHPSLQQKILFADLPSIDRKGWNEDWLKRWHSYNITQSVSIALEKKEIGKVSLPVSDITEYAWSLYDGKKKIYEDSYKTDKGHSFHTFTIPKAMRVDRIVFVVEKGGYYRRLARPLLE